MQAESEVLSLTEQQLHDEYNKTLEKLDNWQIKLQHRFQKSIDEFLAFIPNQDVEFTRKIQKEIFDMETQTMNAFEYLAKFSSTMTSLLSLLLKMALKKKIGQIYLDSMESSKRKIQNAEQEIHDLQFLIKNTKVNNHITYQFSQEFKAPAITLLSPYKIRSGQNQGKLALIEPPFRKNQGIQQVCLRGGTLYGVCHLDIAKQNGWDFAGSSIGHGVYVVQHQGFTWSHSNPKQNQQRTTFKFTEETKIVVRFDPLDSSLIFINDQEEQYIHLDVQVQGDEIYPCVWMYGEGEEAEIL